ncbi:MAG: hydrogenase expression/formation protein HypE [Phycisphaerae bacterium]|nr:hydrogenase expression/formation protein HypE [Phycisphaerae bacterium]
MTRDGDNVERIQLAHGGGGRMTAELIESVILPALGGGDAATLADAAAVDVRGQAAMTTDTYVVQPLEFPGGDIGTLAVAGTVNDLAVFGAVPRALSLGLVIEEGLETALLRRVLESAGRAAADAGVAVVTGDTKVVPRGAVDKLVVNTTGVGEIHPGAQLGFDAVGEGDKIVVSGALGEHGLAVMACREALGLSAELDSDCGSVAPLALGLIERLGDAVRFMRDPTRGGLAATAVELARGTGRDVALDEAAIPVNPTARAAAEMLGLDLLTVANEGKLVAVVGAEAAEQARAVLTEQPAGAHAAVIGTVRERAEMPVVEMTTLAGGRRIVQMPYGEELPRIC